MTARATRRRHVADGGKWSAYGSGPPVDGEWVSHYLNQEADEETMFITYAVCRPVG